MLDHGCEGCNGNSEFLICVQFSFNLYFKCASVNNTIFHAIFHAHIKMDFPQTKRLENSKVNKVF